jgi:aminopeptidase-like protein
MFEPNMNEKDLEFLFDTLWPLPRSISGDGVRESHKVIGEYIDINTYELQTGSKVFDWTIPPEWKVNNAYIICPNGNKILDFHVNNLHLVGYSHPFKGTLSLDELNEKLHSMSDMPGAIPYKTSYYKNDWGFCISEEEKECLEEGEYQVVVDTEHFDGSLTISDCLIQGESEKEILVHTYTCHPSLAINELSGILVAVGIASALQKAKKLKFSYRFVFAPESIGAIAYIHENFQHLKNNLEAGLICTCVGHEGDFNYKKSRHGNALIDRAVNNKFKTESDLKLHQMEFSPRGSDERQYCSIGIDLPVGSLMRTPYHQYPEYHTSYDNKDIISFKGVNETIQAYLDVFNNIERNKTYINMKPNCEPFMSRYPGMYFNKDHRYASDFTVALKWLVHFCDGKNDLIEISDKSGIEINLLAEVAEKMVSIALLNEL